MLADYDSLYSRSDRKIFELPPPPKKKDNKNKQTNKQNAQRCLLTKTINKSGCTLKKHSTFKIVFQGFEAIFFKLLRIIFNFLCYKYSLFLH